MKVTILKEHLTSIIGLVERAAGSGSQLPILNNILIETEDAQLVFTATNLEFAVQATIEASVEEHGKVAVPAVLFSQLIQALRDERITLSSEELGLEISSDRYSGTLAGVALDDFPSIPQRGDDVSIVTLPGSLLRETLSRVVFAAQGTSDFSPELSSVLFLGTNDSLKLVATDSFRLAESTLPQTSLEGDDIRALVPVKVASDLSRFLRDDDEVECIFEEHQAMFVTKRLQLTTRLLAVQFPDYEQIIPNEFESKITMDKQELLAALKLASIFADKGSEVHLTVQEKSVVLSASRDAVGKHTITVSAQLSEPFNEVITVNWRQFFDGLKALSTESVILGLSADKPTLMWGAGDHSYRYLTAQLVS